MKYNWQYKNFPNFEYDNSYISDIIINIAKETGEITGLLQGVSEQDKQEAILQMMITEAIKTSEIEGEYMSREDVMSSIKNNLGLNQPKLNIKDARARGIGALMVKVRASYNEKLTENLLKEWHRILFDSHKGISAGEWRTGKEPMQVVSGAIGKEVVHYEAPPSDRIPFEIERFITWYNDYSVNNNIARAVTKTAIAHLYFETIHPFEDGNGRIGRALAEKTFAESLGRPTILSISNTIEKNKNDYYEALKEAQRTLKIIKWLIYFAKVILDAQKEAKETVLFLLRKTQFFDAFKNQLNERQIKAIQKMWDAGIEGFQGGMTAKKYGSINKTSKATATRDLQHLVEIGALQQKGGGRSVYYELRDF